jgi:hypothetical protein
MRTETDLKRRSVGPLLLYLLESESGSPPVMSGDVARPGSTRSAAPRLNTVGICYNRQSFGSGFTDSGSLISMNPDPVSGSGSKKAKRTHQKSKKLRNFVCWSPKSLDVLCERQEVSPYAFHVGLGRNKCCIYWYLGLNPDSQKPGSGLNESGSDTLGVWNVVELSPASGWVQYNA